MLPEAEGCLPEAGRLQMQLQEDAAAAAQSTLVLICDIVGGCANYAFD